MPASVQMCLEAIGMPYTIDTPAHGGTKQMSHATLKNQRLCDATTLAELTWYDIVSPSLSQDALCGRVLEQ